MIYDEGQFHRLTEMEIGISMTVCVKSGFETAKFH